MDSRQATGVNPGIESITTADIVSDSFIADMENPYENPLYDAAFFVFDLGPGYTGGPNQTYPLTSNTCDNAQYNGPMSVSPFRPGIPRSDYFSLAVHAYHADDCGESEALSAPFGSQNFLVVEGQVRHSVYNTPTESACTDETPSSTWIATPQIGVNKKGAQICNGVSYAATTMDSTFVGQAYLNGTGDADASSNGLIKPFSITYWGGSRCSVNNTPPAGSDAEHIFTKVTSVTGSCNAVMNNNSVAVSPKPAASSAIYSDKPTCGDSILAVNSGNVNVFVKTVADLCPACAQKINNNGLQGHIDNYVASKACDAHSLADLSPVAGWWTANSRDVSQ